ncbi:MAG: hypothetical protein ABWY80_09125 [Acidimicrobiia bacterium]
MWRSRSRVRRAGAAFGLVVALGATAASCSRGEDLPDPKPGFCEAAAKYDKLIERKKTIAEQIPLLEKMQRNAPKDVAADVTYFLDTLRKAADATDAEKQKLQENPKFQQAVERVNRRAINGCGFFDSEPGDGS